MRFQALMFFAGDKDSQVVGIFSGFRVFAVHRYLEVIAVARPDDGIVAFGFFVRWLAFKCDGVDGSRFRAVKPGAFCFAAFGRYHLVCAVGDAVALAVEGDGTFRSGSRIFKAEPLGHERLQKQSQEEQKGGFHAVLTDKRLWGFCRRIRR